MAKVINLAERREQKIQKQLHSPMQGWIVWLKCPKCETREYSELRMPEGRIHKCGTMVEEHEVEIDIRAELTVSLRNSELISELLAKSNAKGIMKKFLKSERAMLEHLERSEEEYRKRLQLMSQQECTPYPEEWDPEEKGLEIKKMDPLGIPVGIQNSQKSTKVPTQGGLFTPSMFPFKRIAFSFTRID